jgi:hypothetical protein
LNPSAVGTVLDHKLVWRVAQGIGEAQSTQDSLIIKNSLTLSLGMFLPLPALQGSPPQVEVRGYVASHVCAATKHKDSSAFHKAKISKQKALNCYAQRLIMTKRSLSQK